MKQIVVWLFLAVITVAVIHVPPESNVQSISIRLGESREINYPSFPFQNVYARDISKFPGESKDFNVDDVCQESAARLKTEQQTYFSINPKRPRKPVIYELEDIIHEQLVIDAALTEQRAYVAFQNGSVLTLDTTLTKNANGDYSSNSNFFQLTQNQTIDSGQFLIGRNGGMSGTTVFFISDKRLFQINSTTGAFTEMKNYKSNRNFQSATIINDKFIAVALGPTGIAFYQLIGNRDGIKYLETIDLTITNKHQFSFRADDITYDNEKYLFVLDYTYGMVMANVRIVNSKVSFELMPQVIKKRNCDNIVFSQGDVYMSCRGVYRYGIHTDRLNQQLPDPMFNVKQLYAYGNLLVIMGQNDFKVYHNDRLVDEIMEQSMDKFLLYGKHYLAVNEYGVAFGNYSIAPPVVKCYTRDPRHEGTYNVIMTTQAECNQEYLVKRDISLPPTYNDTCLYTTPVQLSFWSPRDLSYVPFIVMSVIMGALLVVLIIWMSVVKTREMALRRALGGFHLAGSKSLPYDVMVEEAPNPNDIIANKERSVEMKEGKAVTTAPANPEYDIGD